MTPRQTINLVLSISIGLAALAMFGAIGFFFLREWIRNR